jgi:hypothetical protein
VKEGRDTGRLSAIVKVMKARVNVTIFVLYYNPQRTKARENKLTHPILY